MVSSASTWQLQLSVHSTAYVAADLLSVCSTVLLHIVDWRALLLSSLSVLPDCDPGV
jgi:hypothetical protein